MLTVCVVGAGISGLVAARILQKEGFTVTVYEKSRSLSGRCATRIWNGHVVDHGAQYFTADEATFRDDLSELAGSGLEQLRAPIINSRGEALNDNKARYYLKEGNNRIGKYLSSGVNVVRGTAVHSVRPNSWGIRVEGESFSTDYDAVVICAPLPQASVILGQESTDGHYEPCLTAFFEYEGRGEGMTDSRYGVVEPELFPALGWSACENHKEGRISGDCTVMVVQASVTFSRKYLETEPSGYLPLLRGDLEGLWELPPRSFKDQFAHRWRYARRDTNASPPSGKTIPGTFLCGDSRVPSRVESVWMDGIRVAEEVQAYLS